MADDADGPSNSHIHYSIIEGNQGSPFTIDPIRGEVKVTKPLDRETVSLRLNCRRKCCVHIYVVWCEAPKRNHHPRK